MACSIQIDPPEGKRLPNQIDPSSIVVSGTAQDCSRVNVTISCHSPSPTGGVLINSFDGIANVNSGFWAIEFIGVQNIKCKCAGHVGIRAFCVDDPGCSSEGSFQIPCTVLSDCPYVDDISILLDLASDPPCVKQANTSVAITATAQGPYGAGNYQWTFDDGTNAKTVGGLNKTSVTESFLFPGPAITVSLVYTPSKAGCPRSSPAQTKTVTIPLCPADPIIDEKGGGGDKGQRQPDPVVIPAEDEHTGDKGGGAAGCDALLWGAVGMALLGAAMFGAGVCANVMFLWAAGLALGLLGLGLFFLWWAVCGKISSCGVMQDVHCMLFWMVIVSGVLGLAVTGIRAVSVALGNQGEAVIPMAAVPCVAAAAAFWGWIGTLLALLTWAMKSAGCSTRCP